MKHLSDVPNPLPHVHIITTGGTIAATPSGMLTPDGLLSTIPDLDTLASVTVEPFLDTGSSWITPAHWLQLATRITELWQTHPALSGIVITHGTDTLEETAYFLQLTCQGERPIVLTGAMRVARALSADGPANLRAAIAVAAAESARGQGTLAVLNNEIHAARYATKGHTLRVDAFTLHRDALLGTIYEDELTWLRRLPTATQEQFALSAITTLPRVDILYSYAGADGELLTAAVAAGAMGLVIATMGGGRLSEAQIHAVQTLLAQKVVIALSSRVSSGPVEENYQDNLAPSADVHGVILAGDLNPQKARVLLQLALTRTQDPQIIQTIFRQN
ncbi:MAG: asparaginase [Caldilineaceae bacterium]|nr:asparaginase [Caldilineaceae bacterium]